MMAALGGLAGTVLESSPWWCSYERAATLTSSDTNQAQIQGSELAHHKDLYHLQMVGIHERAGPADPKLQDLYDTRQTAGYQKEYRRGSIINSITEARDLEPDQ
jgi:hypothetical protein